MVAVGAGLGAEIIAQGEAAEAAGEAAVLNRAGGEAGLLLGGGSRFAGSGDGVITR